MNPQKRSRRANVRRAVAPDEPRKAVRKPFKKKPEPTGEPPKRRRRATPADPDERPPGFPLPYIHPEPEES
ncbi:hypothetical protein GR925_19225 [Streptomyces sp. HUCO-GS316]|uniref:hypothetical protein n=1 Tax=Streptomyces sp. HUCO-GS316 TaxID=2692198 RepID=UPI00136DEFB0|nr:hypothetical protein [Streptomyces sp. HUCO-GS316]MXM65526.1 hypothetical protein [Streptomyces sp. HUCO-GS316]